jgi:hypothetical protein
VIITDAALEWQSMSFPVKDLMLFETMTCFSMADICDGMGMYSYIMSNKTGAMVPRSPTLTKRRKRSTRTLLFPDDEARTRAVKPATSFPPMKTPTYKMDYSAHVEALQVQ